MKFKRSRARENLVDITSLIDVVFILLVFFMLSGAIRPTDAFPVDTAVSRSPQFGDIRDMVVLIDERGQVAIDDEPMSRNDLRRIVAAMLVVQPDILIQLKPDANADAALVIEVMEDLRLAGVDYLVILTKGAGLEGEDG